MLCLLETMWKKHLMRILPELLVVAPKLQGSGNPALTRDSLHMVFAAESEILKGLVSGTMAGLDSFAVVSGTRDYLRDQMCKGR